MFNHPYQLQKLHEIRYQALQQEARLTAYHKLKPSRLNTWQRYLIHYLAESLITAGRKLQAHDAMAQTNPKLLT